MRFVSSVVIGKSKITYGMGSNEAREFRATMQVAQIDLPLLEVIQDIVKPQARGCMAVNCLVRGCPHNS